MRHLIRIVPSLLSLLTGSAFAETDPAPAWSDRRILVRFTTGTTPESSEVANVCTLVNGTLEWWATEMVPRLAVIRVPSGTVETAIPIAAACGGVAYAEHDVILKLHRQSSNAYLGTSDTHFSDQWWARNTGQTVHGVSGTAGADCRAFDAWEIATNGAGVITVVFDTGVNYLHDDLAPNVWTNPGETANGIDDDLNGFKDDLHGIGVDRTVSGPQDNCSVTIVSSSDCISDVGDYWLGDPLYVLCGSDSYDVQGSVPRARAASDSGGHGTTVAALIGSVGDNARNVAGVAWQAKIMSIRVFNGCHYGLASDFLKGFEYAYKKGAKVANCSFGFFSYSQAMYDAFFSASADGLLCIISAGNNATDLDQTSNPMNEYPAEFPFDGIVCVAATDQFDHLASFSNYGGTSVDLGAPGVNMRGYWNSADTLAGGYYLSKFWDGTSFASAASSGNRRATLDIPSDLDRRTGEVSYFMLCQTVG
jgi:subtilisin family serine protease